MIISEPSLREAVRWRYIPAEAVQNEGGLMKRPAKDQDDQKDEDDQDDEATYH